MDSAAYERMISARFAILDQDGSGYIDREDFSTAAAAVLAEFGTTARCDKGQALYIGAEAFWQGMAGIADRDGDQRITEEEFVTGAAKRLRDSPERFADIALPFLHALVSVADQDGDGAATPEEAQRVLQVLGVDQGRAGSIAAGLDADGDGRIVESEFVAAFSAYFTTAAPDA
jgi:Ca2+-binding EF-hand superfamily protein